MHVLGVVSLMQSGYPNRPFCLEQVPDSRYPVGRGRTRPGERVGAVQSLLFGMLYDHRRRRKPYAQRPRSAINAHPAIMHPIAYASLEFDALIISLLNRNSCASNYDKKTPHSSAAINIAVRFSKSLSHLDETCVYQDTR